ncbi:MAG TPA: phosphate ABC transporter substrate-binding protein PstS [Polyangiaceae bacterium]|nr:phosphate ABC transporter substrate-binding protein PstS [Polyangiaceae bacterium]
MSLKTAIVAAFALLFLGCAKRSESTPDAEGEAQPRPGAGADGSKVKLIGSGASFPAPIYDRWFKEFTKQDGLIRVDYQSVGSGQGVKSFIEGHTDFGASDAAMNDEEIKKAKGNVLLLPVTAGSIVLAYNLEGVEGLKLSREAYSGIFLGQVKKWNDPKIAASNPGVQLPDVPIAVVHRSDGSGTTFVFTQHLAAISEAWKTKPGVGKSIEWPTGIGAKGNEGVSAQIKQTPAAIGYVEYAYAVLSKQSMAELENKSGKYVKPTLESAAASLGAVELPADMRAWVTDPEGEASYPIVTYTWILAKQKYDDPAKAAALKKVLSWSLSEGQKLAPSLNYIPLPENVASKVRGAVATIN